MLPGFWEFLLIAVVGGWIIVPFFHRRHERLKARRSQGKKATNSSSKTAKKNTPHKDAIDVEYEEL